LELFSSWVSSLFVVREQEVVGAYPLGLSPGSLSGGADLGHLSSTALKYLGPGGKICPKFREKVFEPGNLCHHSAD
jgi:hypothetical protein